MKPLRQAMIQVEWHCLGHRKWTQKGPGTHVSRGCVTHRLKVAVCKGEKPQKKPTLPTLPSETSSLQNYEQSPSVAEAPWSAVCYTVALLLLFSRVQLSVIPWTTAHRASKSFTSFQSLLKLMSIDSVMPSNHLILCHPLLLLPSIVPSIRVFSSEPALRIRWPKYPYGSPSRLIRQMMLCHHLSFGLY